MSETQVMARRVLLTSAQMCWELGRPRLKSRRRLAGQGEGGQIKGVLLDSSDQALDVSHCQEHHSLGT